MAKIYSIVLTSLALLGSLCLADEVTKRTVFTVNEPLIVAGVPQVTLEPGRYSIRLLNSSSNRSIVQIFNERGDKLFTTALAISNYRMTPTDKTVLRYWETPRGNPLALRAWFPPFENYGQEFVYPKGLAAKIAQETGQPVLTAEAKTLAEMKTAPVTQVAETGKEQPLEPAFIAAAEPAPEPLPEPAPPPARVAVAKVAPARVLPVTGSPYFEIALLGLIAATAGVALRLTFTRLS